MHTGGIDESGNGVQLPRACLSVRARARACVRARSSVRACVHVCVRACVRACGCVHACGCVRACECVCACVHAYRKTQRAAPGLTAQPFLRLIE